jgi:hypothetical protein
MPSTLFDSAGLAIVAYAQIDGPTGSVPSTGCNSGLGTTRLSTGIYQIALPTALGQDPGRDLIFVQPKWSQALPYSSVRSAVVTDPTPGIPDDDTIKQVSIFGNEYDNMGVPLATTALDSDFNILILRTILP